MKNRLLIFEGSDCTGKSTLINKIYETYETLGDSNVILIHNGVYESRAQAFEAYCDQLSDNADKAILLDRSYISELIYGSIYRNEHNSKWKSEIRLVESMASNYYKPLVINCTPPFCVVFDSWVGRINSEYLKDSEVLESVYNEYKKNIKVHTSLPVVNFDYTQIEKSYLAFMKGLLQ